ncbi:MAG: hypothetical protein OXR66_08715 [Candidatus Woesearchaeota archaeon]|nr:hypothetical protein [Candidatus Woesearchaeota archaeon]
MSSVQREAVPSFYAPITEQADFCFQQLRLAVNAQQDPEKTIRAYLARESYETLTHTIIKAAKKAGDDRLVATINMDLVTLEGIQHPYLLQRALESTVGFFGSKSLCVFLEGGSGYRRNSRLSIDASIRELEECIERGEHLQAAKEIGLKAGRGKRYDVVVGLIEHVRKAL